MTYSTLVAQGSSFGWTVEATLVTSGNPGKALFGVKQGTTQINPADPLSSEILAGCPVELWSAPYWAPTDALSTAYSSSNWALHVPCTVTVRVLPPAETVTKRAATSGFTPGHWTDAGMPLTRKRSRSTSNSRSKHKDRTARPMTRRS